MTITAAQQQVVVNRQVQAWKAELRRESARLAELNSAATGKHHAVVMMFRDGGPHQDDDGQFE